MPPKAINYKANSIVYFKGDKGENVFVLQKGQVSLNYMDIQTGQEMHDFVQTGEFFGVKAAFGKYPHDETAVVAVDSTIIQFSVDDFENLLSTNDRVIMKMLKVFSNQLRRIHKQVRSLLSSDEHMNPEKGLFSVGEYYFNTKKYKQAADAFNRYMIYYPAGRFVDEVRRKIEYATMQGDSVPVQEASAPVREVPKAQITIAEADRLRDRQQYAEACRMYLKVAHIDPENKSRAEFEAGICMYREKKGKETIRIFTDLLKRNPAHSKMGEALYYIGKSYLMVNEVAKARGFLTKSSSMLPADSPLQRDAETILHQMGD